MSAEKQPEYTREELIVLASVRKSSGRTCRRCAWFVPKGSQRGCYPNGKYRKWLSQSEYDSGCEGFAPRK